MECEDCLEVCFVGLVVGRICVWYLVSCHIYGIWTSRSKEVCRMLKSHQLGVAMQGGFFVGKAGSHYVMLLYCETLLQVLLSIYFKRFYWIHLFTIPLLLCVFEVGKAKSAAQSVLIMLTLNAEWAVPKKCLSFLRYPWEF